MNGVAVMSRRCTSAGAAGGFCGIVVTRSQHNDADLFEPDPGKEQMVTVPASFCLTRRAFLTATELALASLRSHGRGILPVSLEPAVATSGPEPCGSPRPARRAPKSPDQATRPAERLPRAMTPAQALQAPLASLPSIRNAA